MNSRREKFPTKYTRWDRIRKRYLSSVNFKTETVRKLLKMDFIGKSNVKILNGEINSRLDPNLVMDLRHEIKIPQKVPMPIAAKSDSCINHNLHVEEQYILNELNKFRDNLNRSRKRYELKPRKEKLLSVSNTGILESLESVSQCIEDFYVVPIEAMKSIGAKTICETQNDTGFVDQSKANEYLILKTAEGSQSSQCSSQCIDSNINGKSVRFEEDGKIVGGNHELPIEQEDIEAIVDEAQIEIATEMERSPQIQSADDFLQIKKINVPQVKREEMQEISGDISISPKECTETGNAIISHLFQSHPNTDIGLLRKYFLKWIHYTTFEKIEKQNSVNQNDRIFKINTFLASLQKEKMKLANKGLCEKSTAENANKIHLPAQVTKKYRNKIKIQQDIIELQRLKLERQERLIMRLKLNKLSEEMEEAREEVKKELKAAMHSGDANFRAKAKCIQLIGDLRDDEDEEYAKLQGTALMTPKFLARMQERALERSVKHEKAKQRRLQIEAEREAQKFAMEEAKRRQDEEAKLARIEELKEKRRLEKMAKIIKERERQNAIANNKKANDFYCNYLLRKIGFEGFRRLLKQKRENQSKSDNFRSYHLKKTAFTAWKQHYEQICEEKNQRAERFYENLIKKSLLAAWVSYTRTERSKYLVAIDWYDLKQSEMIFNRWYSYTKLRKIVEESKMLQATSHYEWHLKWKVVDCWQRLPQILKIEKETEERRQRWRIKIWELLPDYTPNRDEIP